MGGGDCRAFSAPGVRNTFSSKPVPITASARGPTYNGREKVLAQLTQRTNIIWGRSWRRWRRFRRRRRTRPHAVEVLGEHTLATGHGTRGRGGARGFHSKPVVREIYGTVPGDQEVGGGTIRAGGATVGAGTSGPRGRDDGASANGARGGDGGGGSNGSGGGHDVGAHHSASEKSQLPPHAKS